MSIECSVLVDEDDNPRINQYGARTLASTVASAVPRTHRACAGGNDATAASRTCERRRATTFRARRLVNLSSPAG
jgi:hypothetical protein